MGAVFYDMPMRAERCEVFVSHSSSDRTLADALVVAIRTALHISARKVRCTSVDGYRLPVGVRADDYLRAEILAAPAFVALLTPASLASTYVLFELGARWGAGMHMAPLLARGLTPHAVAGPIASLNVLDLKERRQVLQLIDDLTDVLDRKLEPLPAFDSSVDLVVSLATDIPASANTPLALPSRLPPIHEDELKILQLSVDTFQPTVGDVMKVLGIREAKAQYYVEKLAADQLIAISNTYFHNHWPVLEIVQGGRKILVEAGLL
jgi:hypothetical protein